MKSLKDILYKTHIVEVIGTTDLLIENLTMDSRAVKNNSLFIAVRGTQTDGHDYIEKAVASGAIAIVCEDIPHLRNEKVTYIKVTRSSEALGMIAAHFFDNPSEKIKVIAVTGTNGKTTTVSLLYRLAVRLGKKAGLISTIVNRINDREIAATHTTPDAITLNQMLAEMVEEQCAYCFMEASSHALQQHRVTGIAFSGAVFTNITHDHLDYHKTFSEYIKAKKMLFDTLPSSAFALINHDDKNGEVMVQNCRAKIKRFALQTMADYKAKIIENGFSGLHLFMDHKDIYTQLIGTFNAYNILGVYAVAMELGWEQMEVLTQLSAIAAPDGRFQQITTGSGITAVIDYAHTPDALKNVLQTLSEIRTAGEQIITLVGCGGNRDREKRPDMARIAAKMSDRVILTSDNPRSEIPELIIDEMKAGLDPTLLKKTLAVTDRREAIKLACTLAAQGDIILLAGKGHEKYQEIKGKKLPFDDYQIAKEILDELEK